MDSERDFFNTWENINRIFSTCQQKTYVYILYTKNRILHRKNETLYSENIGIKNVMQEICYESKNLRTLYRICHKSSKISKTKSVILKSFKKSFMQIVYVHATYTVFSTEKDKLNFIGKFYIK